MIKESFTQPWKEFAKRWEKYYTPPGRPSKEAIKYYIKFAKLATKNLKTKRALVLGSTPELRDLLFELNFEVTIIDVNMEMILAMSELTKHKNPDEVIVRASWTEMPLDSDYYDIVLGDIVLSNIPEKKQEQFLKEIRRVLKKKGYWITKIEVIPNDWVVEKFDVRLKQYEKLPELRNTAMELFCCLHNDAWDPKTQIIDTSKTRDWIDKYKIKEGIYKHPNKKITKYLNDTWEMWKPFEKKWAVKYEKDIEKQISSYFEIINKHVLHDCQDPEVDKTFPMWSCKVK